MEIYIAPGGRKEGPYTMYRIREKLDAGDIDRKTLGWARGEDGWKPLEEIPFILAEIEKLEQQELDEKSPPPLKRVDYTQPLAGNRQITSHAFCRFGARMLDLFIFQVIIWAIIGVPEAPEPRGLKEMIMEGPTPEETAFSYRVLILELGTVLGWHLVEAVLLAAIGYTPGKFLFNLRVRDRNGNRLKFGTSLLRAFQVWVLGMGAGFPPLQYVAEFLGFRRLQTRGVTWWDQNQQLKVTQGKLSRERVLCVLLLFGLLVILRSWL